MKLSFKDLEVLGSDIDNIVSDSINIEESEKYTNSIVKAINNGETLCGSINSFGTISDYTRGKELVEEYLNRQEALERKRKIREEKIHRMTMFGKIWSLIGRKKVIGVYDFAIFLRVDDSLKYGVLLSKDDFDYDVYSGSNSFKFKYYPPRAKTWWHGKEGTLVINGTMRNNNIVIELLFPDKETIQIVGSRRIYYKSKKHKARITDIFNINNS